MHFIFFASSGLGELKPPWKLTTPEISADGKLSGRGAPWLRGVICGLMTMVGGLGHTLPYLIRNFHTATTLAIVVVIAELAAISWIRKRFMDTPLLSAVFQVGVGGVLVFIAGWLIGSG